VPRGDDQNVYLVVNNLGRIWPEADTETADLETIIADLLRAVQESGPGRGFQHRRRLVAGCLRRRRPGAAPALRPADAHIPVS
jgi:hypothetical protein